ncbi:MAG: iron ABC transporter permease [Planctomycetota bacterium]
MNRRLLLLTAAAVAVLILAPLAGRAWIPPAAVFDPAVQPGHAIFWDLRVARVLMAFTAGAALAICGMAFQAMFRNPLAEPFTLGVSSGAAFGAALALAAGWTLTIAGVPAVSFCAFVGAVLAMLTVYTLARMRREFATLTLLLAGVAVNFFFASLVLLLQYFAGFVDSQLIIIWLMGGLSVTGFGPFWDALPFFAAGTLIIMLLRNELNLLSMGEETAVARGVEADQVRKLLFFATSLTVGGIVAVTGPIGFVGMMVPHMARRIVGADHRRLGPACILLGGAFLVACDTIGRTVHAGVEIPVGVITALLGGPFFLWLLLRGEV